MMASSNQREGEVGEKLAELDRRTNEEDFSEFWGQRNQRGAKA